VDRRGRRRDRLAAVPGLYAAAVLAAVLLFAAGAAVATSVQGHAASDPVIVAAGDICGSATDCAPTATLIDQINPDRVLTLGDNAYEDGTLAQYNAYYAPNWGRFLDKTAPSPGNHEYHTANAQGYFSYFGAKAPGPYYSYDVGSWHLISLTGDISVSAGSAQETWLKADLAAHPSQCTLAYWHEPRFSSGTTHGSSSSFDQFWRDLYAAGADIILNGHEHNYERFAPQSPGATADPKGIREFVVGTGGVSHGYSFGTPIANSEVRNSTTWGVIKLTLHSGSYDWQFVPVAGGVFTDSGSGSCSGAAPPPTTTVATTTAATTTTATSTAATTTAASTTTSATTTAPAITTARTTARRCAVPKVLGLMLPRARAALSRARCTVGRVSSRYSARGKGRVIAQHPKQGTRLANRGRVNLVISRGRRR